MNKTNLKALSRVKNKKWLGRKKADVRAGGLARAYDTDEEVECSGCRRQVYLTDKQEDISDMVKKKCVILCPYCVLKETKDLNEEQRKILGTVIKRFESEQRNIERNLLQVA